MTPYDRSLIDVFPGAFQQESVSLAAAAQVIKVEVCQSECRMEVYIRSKRKLTEDDRALLTACIDVYLEGRVQVLLIENEPVNLQEMTDNQKKYVILERLREEQPSCAALLHAMPFLFEKGRLEIQVRPSALKLMRLRHTKERLEEILQFLGMESVVELIENEAVKPEQEAGGEDIPVKQKETAEESRPQLPWEEPEEAQAKEALPDAAFFAAYGAEETLRDAGNKSRPMQTDMPDREEEKIEEPDTMTEKNKKNSKKYKSNLLYRWKINKRI